MKLHPHPFDLNKCLHSHLFSLKGLNTIHNIFVTSDNGIAGLWLKADELRASILDESFDWFDWTFVYCFDQDRDWISTFQICESLDIMNGLNSYHFTELCD